MATTIRLARNGAASDVISAIHNARWPLLTSFIVSLPLSSLRPLYAPFAERFLGRSLSCQLFEAAFDQRRGVGSLAKLS